METVKLFRDLAALPDNAKIRFEGMGIDFKTLAELEIEEIVRRYSTNELIIRLRVKR